MATPRPQSLCPTELEGQRTDCENGRVLGAVCSSMLLPREGKLGLEGEKGSAWLHRSPRLQKFTTVFSYIRPGLWVIPVTDNPFMP